MFSTAIDIDTDGNIVMHDKNVALLPCLWDVYKDKHLGSKAVKWIVAMFDMRSPYRFLPKTSREEIVNSKILESTTCKFKNNKKILLAIEEYKLINFNPDIHEYQAMVDKSAEFVKVFNEIPVNEKNLSVINDLQIEMGKAAKSRREIRNAIIKEQEEGSKISGMDNDDFSIFEHEERLT